MYFKKILLFSLLSTVSCYLTPTQFSTKTLLYTKNNNDEIFQKKHDLILDVNCKGGETTDCLQEIFFNFKVKVLHESYRT